MDQPKVKLDIALVKMWKIFACSDFSIELKSVDVIFSPFVEFDLDFFMICFLFCLKSTHIYDLQSALDSASASILHSLPSICFVSVFSSFMFPNTTFTCECFFKLVPEKCCLLSFYCSERYKRTKFPMNECTLWYAK